MEIWKDIKGYEGSYMVSNYGRVKSLEKNIESHNHTRTQYRPEKILKQYKNKWGYMRVYLTQNSIKKMYAVHRLVASAFIDNPNNKPCVNHIDNDRSNNHLDNLEWCTYKENNNWAKKQGRRVFTEEWKRKSMSNEKELTNYQIYLMLLGYLSEKNDDNIQILRSLLIELYRRANKADLDCHESEVQG